MPVLSTATDKPRSRSQIGLRRSAALSRQSSVYAERRSALLAAAAAVFKEKGFFATSLSDVVKAAGTDRSTLYYYVANKRELFREVVYGATLSVVEQAELVADRHEQSPAERLGGLIHVLMEGYQIHYPHLFVYMQEDVRRALEDDTTRYAELVSLNRRYHMAMVNVIQEGLDAGTFRSALPADILARGITSIVVTSSRWYRADGALSAAEIADGFTVMVVDGLRPSVAKARQRSR